MGKKAGTGISDDGRNGSFTEQEQENADAVSALVLDNGINFTGMLISCRPWRTAPEPNRGGAAIKYYDLAQVGDEMAGDHYRRLAHHADECIYCGVCEKNCPFHVGIMDIMREMKAFFA